MEAISTYELKNKKLKIYQDSDSESPREWDNLGNMIILNRKYNHLGDKHNYSGLYAFYQDLLSCTYEQLEHLSYEQMEKKANKKAVILPLYLYDHSGITMNTTGFSCPWDSGQVGFIYVTKEDIRKEYNCKRITKKIRDLVVKVLEGEVKTYDQYLTGDIYGFVIENENGEEGDSCWGFFGNDIKENGMLEHVGKEWLEVI